jgi:tetratricopeptide (TPR) repeat protein
MQRDPSDKSKMDMMSDLLLAGKLSQAQSVADSISDVDYREWMLNDLVKNMISAGAVDSAATVARFMALSYYKADALRSIAKCMASAGNLQGALSILQEADKVPTEVVLLGELDSDIAPDKAAVLYDIAKLFATAGDQEHAASLRSKAIEVAHSGEASPNRQHSLESSKALRSFAMDLALSEDMAAARTLAESITNPFIQGETLDMLDEMSGQSTET